MSGSGEDRPEKYGDSASGQTHYRKSGAGGYQEGGIRIRSAIAVAVLSCLEQIPRQRTEGILFVGELSLDGGINGIRGVMELVSCAVRQGCHTCIVPEENLAEGSVIQGIKVLGAGHIRQVIRYLRGQGELEQRSINIEEIRNWHKEEAGPDFSQIQGQFLLRRARRWQ